MSGQKPDLFSIKKLGAVSPNQKKGEIKYGLSSFMTNVTNNTSAQQKRPISQISKEPISNAEFFKTGLNENYIEGRFRYKF
jgi:hypothetical protein